MRSAIRRCSCNRLGAVILGVVAILPGCAAVLASRQPDKRDMAVLDPGVPRTHVIAELGKPIWSDDKQGQAVDVFAFKQGYAKSTKAARALVHGAADVATFGLWEVVGVPAETIIDGTDVQLEVHYDDQMNVERVVVIKGEKAVKPPTHLLATTPEQEARASRRALFPIVHKKKTSKDDAELVR